MKCIIKIKLNINKQILKTKRDKINKMNQNKKNVN